MLQPGDQLGNYEIVSLLGSGGMGVVYHARHTALGTEHALKVLAENYAANEKVRIRFQQEARIQAEMLHPNIVRVTDFVQQKRGIGMIMELVRGRSLDEVIDDGVTGGIFDSLDELVQGLPTVLALDRSRVRSHAVRRFGPERMVAEHVEAYARLVTEPHGAERTA